MAPRLAYFKERAPNIAHDPDAAAQECLPLASAPPPGPLGGAPGPLVPAVFLHRVHMAANTRVLPPCLPWQAWQVQQTLVVSAAMSQRHHSAQTKRANRLARLVCKHLTYKTRDPSLGRGRPSWPTVVLCHVLLCTLLSLSPLHAGACQLPTSQDKPTITLPCSGLHNAHPNGPRP